MEGCDADMKVEKVKGGGGNGVEREASGMK